MIHPTLNYTSRKAFFERVERNREIRIIDWEFISWRNSGPQVSNLEKIYCPTKIYKAFLDGWNTEKKLRGGGYRAEAKA